MSEQIVELEVGVNAPKFCLPDKDNQKVCLEDFQGKFIMFNFWATW